AGRALRTAEHEHLVLEALASQLVPRFDDRAALCMNAAPSGDGLARDERLALGAPADDLAAAQDDPLRQRVRRACLIERGALLAHRRAPFQRPVSAASMQSAVLPNHA